MPNARISGLVLVVLGSSLVAQSWPNAGGNPQRNGLSRAYGPLTPQVAWTETRASFLGWQPFVAGNRVFAVRQSGSPPSAEPLGSPVLAYDRNSGTELWRADLPYGPGEWTTWILGTSNGLVYATRSGNGTATPSRIHALDQATGASVWISQEATTLNYSSGGVFAPNGDLILGDFLRLVRIRASDGTTVWSVPRSCASNTACAGALFGDSVYIVDANVVKRFDLETGAFRYRSPQMTGAGAQHAPMIGPDGTIYINHAGNNPATDNFHAWTDTGTEFVERWRLPSAYAPFSTFAVGPENWVYLLQRENVFSAVDGRTGLVQALYDLPFANNQVQCAVDADGRVFVTDAGTPTTRLYSFEADLTLRWSATFSFANGGGPALADDGTLLIASRDALVAYRTPSPWTDLGGGIAGATGSSSLEGRGTLTANKSLHLTLTGAPPNTASTLLVGGSAVGLPILGGTLWPSPDLAIPGLPIGSGGSSELSLVWPAGAPTGTGLWFQHWYLDATTPSGLGASNGLRGISP